MFNPRETFSKRLKLLREAKGITQGQLAKSIKINRISISGYETMDRFPSIEVIINIADFFNVSIDYLVGYQNAIPVQYIKMFNITKKDANTSLDVLYKIQQMIKSSVPNDEVQL